MTEIEEGDLKFSFPGHCEVGKYDEWSFYRNQFQSVAGGSKAVDILCLSDDAAWLIEIKDYRQHPRQKPTRSKLIDIGDVVAGKVRDTLAGLAAASANANCGDERALARRALQRRRWRVALHLEQRAAGPRLWPRKSRVVNVVSKMRTKVKAVDAHPVILDRAEVTRRCDIPWSVQ